MFLGIFSWGVVGGVVVLLIGMAFTLESGKINLPYEPILVRMLFGVALLLLSIRTLWWLAFQQPKEERGFIPVIGAAIFLALMGASLAAFMKWVSDRESAESKERFGISLVNSFIGGNWFAYATPEADLYMIDVLANIDLVNQDTAFAKIHDYSAQILLGDTWAWLRRIPTFGNGKFYFGVEQIDKAKRISFDLETIDKQIRRRNLRPGETISGILVFFLKEADRSRFANVKAKALKLTIIDSLRRKEEHLLSLGLEDGAITEDPGMGWLSALAMKIEETDVDLSKARILRS